MNKMVTITLSAVGDICFARELNNLILKKGVEYPFEKVKSILDKQDILFGSLESIFLPPDYPKKKLSGNYQALYSSDKAKEVLKNIKFDVVNLATNHALDLGSKGLSYTIDAVKQASSIPIGVGKNKKETNSTKIISKKGAKIGFLGYTDIFRWILKGGSDRISYFDEKKATEKIRKLKSKVDIVVVSLHSDIEFSKVPSISRINICRKMIEAGAKIILCHHPHVPQGIEMYKGGLIAYSLGNFVFDIGTYQEKHNRIDSLRSYILKIKIHNNKIKSWKRVYLKIKKNEHRPYPLKNYEKKKAEKYYKRLDWFLRNEKELREEWHKTCQYWFNILWKDHKNLKANSYMKDFGWRLLNCYPHFLAGLKDMADLEFKKKGNNDFKYNRPFSPFEKDSRNF